MAAFEQVFDGAEGAALPASMPVAVTPMRSGVWWRSRPSGKALGRPVVSLTWATGFPPHPSSWRCA